MNTIKIKPFTKIVCLSLGLMPTVSTLHASDLEIYKGNTGGTATVMLMLDTSGSMGYGLGYQNSSVGSMSIEDDYGVCTDSNGYSTVANNPINSGTTPAYNRYFCPVTASAARNNPKVTNATTGCEKQSNGSYRCYDRLTRLKDALFKLMEDTTLKTDTAIGLGNFSARGDGKSGQILVAAKPIGALNSTQRNAIKTAAANLDAASGTPSAHAYAEVAAYMLGNATSSINKNIIHQVAYRTYISWGVRYYNECNVPSSTVSYLNGTAYKNCTSFKSDTRTNPKPSATYLGSGNGYDFYMTPTLYYDYQSANNDSGMQYSVDKSDIYDDTFAKYISPLSQTNKSCNGQGIYFLTDGFPNSSSPGQGETIMQSAIAVRGLVVM